MSADGPRRRGSTTTAALAWVLAAGVPLVFLSVFFLWPVATMVGRGFLPGGEVDLGGIAEVFARRRTWRVIGITVGQSVTASVAAVLLGVPGAYVLYRCRFRGRRLVRGFITVPFVLPTVVVGVAFRSLLVETGPLGFLGIDGTFAAVVAALVFFNYALVVRTVGALWERLDPRAEEAARSLGASPWRAFRTVTLPALAPAIVSAGAVVFLFCATSFGVVLTMGGLRYGTIETEVWIQTTQFLDLRAAAVLSVLQLVVVGAALLLAARARRRYDTSLHLRADRSATRPLRLRRRAGHPGTDLLPAAVTAVVVVGLLVLPLAYLAVGSLRAPEGWGLGNYRRLATTGGTNALTVTVWDATLNSLRAAVDATVIAVVVGTLVAVVVSRRPRSPGGRRALGVLDAVFMLPLGVSAVTVGFGFLITLDSPPLDLRASPVIVPIAQAVVATPIVVRTVLPVLRAVDPRLREAAAALGAAPARVLLTVDGPFLVRGLGLAVGFAFAVSLGEFGATSFLARPDTPTLPVVIFRLIGRPGAENYGMALAAAVVLAALTASVMMLAERLRGDRMGTW
ncbi:iron ABC transporter permease [Georgenia sp. H159]|uniref:ABC transporter permease n=1 Tax=Georgenia sp. H159 TaxID=3076115 RepID=UPI002D788B04|nr:iron ABC transporter permease [Georgenia sp. H159]